MKGGQNVPSILSLPNEILFKIFKYIPNSEMHNSVAFVCKKLQGLSLDPKFILEVYINRYKLYIGMKRTYLNDPSQKVICEFLTKSRYLSKLTIKNRTDVEFLVLSAQKSCINLRHLEIINDPGIIKKIRDDALVSMYKWSDKLIF